MPFDTIRSKELKAITWMFTQTNWFDVYSCYESFMCKKCKKFDCLKATQNGICAAPILPTKIPDFYRTTDLRAYLVSSKTRNVIESFSGEIAEFYPIPKYSDHFVLLPKQLLFHPQKIRLSDCFLDGEAFRSDRTACSECKLYPDLCFNSKQFMVPDDVIFAGIVLDTKGLRLTASREFSDYLRKAKLSGLEISKDTFANPKK